MTHVLEINELDHHGSVLMPTAAERRALQRVRDRLGLEWRPDGTVRISPGGYVGTVRLSPDLAVSITTKVPVAKSAVARQLGLSEHALAHFRRRGGP